MNRKASELPFQCLARAALWLVINHVKDFDGTVRGTCCEALAVVIQLRVVLGKVTVSVMTIECAHAGAYDHVLMCRFNGHCV
jgi:hypothetical protein